MEITDGIFRQRGIWDSPTCLVFQAQLASTPSAEFSLFYWMKENLLSSLTVVLSLPFIFGVWKVFLDRWQQYVSVNGLGICLRECYSFSKPDSGLIYENHSVHIVFCSVIETQVVRKNYIFWIKIRIIFWKEQIIYKIKSWHLQALGMWLQALKFD